MPSELLKEEVLEQQAFAASAAALVASHAMADSVWDAYFSELPAKQPELRTVLIDIHRRALVGDQTNLTEAKDLIKTRFRVSDGTAEKWLNLLEDLGLLVRLESEDRRVFKIVPSKGAKYGLFKVGEEYLTCLRLVFRALRPAMKREAPDDESEWLNDIKDELQKHVGDYATVEGVKKKKTTTTRTKPSV
jgi:hypothetical protein